MTEAINLAGGDLPIVGNPSHELCHRCGKEIDFQPGETYKASTDGKVWHYGCGPSTAPPATDQSATITELVDALEAVKEFADEGETQLCWETAETALAKVRSQQ